MVRGLWFETRGVAALPTMRVKDLNADLDPHGEELAKRASRS
jgi:hypothetical protein